MQITFLGTTCMVPTKDRNHISTFLSYGSEGILIDCGEGTQRQMKIAGIKLTKITKILISHWHGDHVLGLPGILQSLSASDYTKTLQIFGPEGTKERIKKMMDVFIFDNKLEFEVYDIKDRKFYESTDYYLEAFELNHSVKCIGFNFIENDKRKIKIAKVKRLGIPEGPLLGKIQNGNSIVFKGKKISPDVVSYIVKGKKLSFISDTDICKNCYDIAENADLLVCESAYSSKLVDKARKYKHLTAKEAALIASKSNVKKMVLTHFSSRYKNTQEIEDDARDYFNNVICAKDFMKIKV